ncbi:TopoII/MutL transducer domain-containing protein [Streptomyces tendae]|uniref:hypothetical protein n=1 Tax=Streptomyces tendae TaxID=1932 RepID=UPI0036BE0684
MSAAGRRPCGGPARRSGRRDRRLRAGAGTVRGHGPGSGAQRTAEGLTVVVSVKVDRPEFQGPTRGELAGAAVRARVGAAVRERLGTWLAERPEQVEAILCRTGRRAGCVLTPPRRAGPDAPSRRRRGG